MWGIKTRHSKKSGLLLTRQNLAKIIVVEQKKTVFWSKIQTISLLSFAAVIFVMAATILTASFYNAPILFAKNGWVNVRNLTPIEDIQAEIGGVIENIFVSQGQIVQKGELLGAIKTDSIRLDYADAQINFADKVLELHCLVSLQSGKSSYVLPYDAQVLIDTMTAQANISNKRKTCERELLRNAIAEQFVVETIAALEDQFRLLNQLVKDRSFAKQTFDTLNDSALIAKEGENSKLNNDNTKAGLAYNEQFKTATQFAQVQRELQITRKEYFFRKLQKEKDLSSAIKQTTQEIRYLDKRLRELKDQLAKNFIYASRTGTIVPSKIVEVGSSINQYDAVFKLQPVEKKFRFSIPIEDLTNNSFAVGTHVTISLSNHHKRYEPLEAETIAIERKPNGKLEAVMEILGDPDEATKIILASGFKDIGEQRIPATITSGQTKTWQSIKDIIFKRV
jgi:multidrug efflux pump subunit AcrA (membrane-fusion protein)